MRAQNYRCGEKEITVIGDETVGLTINNENGDAYVPVEYQTVVDVEGVRYTMTDRGLEQV
jgi:hypothetical protein